MSKDVLDHKCPSCGAVLLFNPTIGKWKCNYCDSEFTLEQLMQHDNASREEYHTNENEEQTKSIQSDEQVSYVRYYCKDCGAEIIADENTASTFCVYCGNTAILKDKLTGEFAPKKIIPFKTVKADAVKAFKNLSKGRPLMPKTFNSEANIEKISGIYIPFWLFDVNVSGDVELDATKVKSWTVGDTHYTKTDYYKLYRTCSIDYKRIPVDGATRFDNDIMNTIEPFDYKELTDYNHAYLSGFLAEKYDVPSNDSFKDAGVRAINSSNQKIISDVKNYSSKSISKNGLVAKQADLEYALLPVWMVNVKYNGKYYIFAMNGQTGEFIGNIPIDKKKTVFLSLVLFFGTFIIGFIVSYAFYLLGR